MGLSLIASVLPMLPALPAAAAPNPGAPGPSHASVSMKALTAKAASKAQTDGAGVTTLPDHTLPAGGTAFVPVASTGSGTISNVGGVGVRFAAVAPAGGSKTARAGAAKSAAAGSVTVTVLPSATATALGVRGVVVTVAGASISTSAVQATFDTSSFANAYGAGYGSRVRLVEMPACALTTPSVSACQTETDLGSTNINGQVSAALSIPTATTAATGRAAVAPDTMVIALTGSASDAGATYSATSLSPAYQWSAGDQGGSFTSTYPFDVPAALGGPKPDVELDYDSGGVDAQTLAQNGQASWAGEGWDLETGYVEQDFRTCNLDGGTTGDLCAFSPNNATMVFQGQSVRLVKDKTTNVWHSSDDSAVKVDQIEGTGAANAPGTNNTKNNEYWRVITQDGTTYYFGINHRYAGDTAVTNAAQYEPVFFNNSGENPAGMSSGCYNATFANASCEVGYRWNLDYVVDTAGNSMSYVYNPLTGYVGTDNNAKVQKYVIQDTLAHIDYGTRAGSEATQTAPMRVVLGAVNRCSDANSTCTQGSADYSMYPDTPWDLYCGSSTSCPSTLSPVFFDPYKLATVTTEVLSGASYRNVDVWKLDYTFPASGDYIDPAGNDTSPNLWLNTITHVGYAPDGTSMTDPQVTTFGGTRMANRTDWGNDIGVAPYMHYRLTQILNGMGGETDIAYSGVPCTRAQSTTIDAANNSLLCFPQYFKPQIAAAGWGWFNKYTVSSVTEKDLTGGSPNEVWSYAYSTTGSSSTVLWHHDYNETSTLAFRSWNVFNGFSTVTVTHGATGGPQTVTTSLYYRGMDGDALDPSNQTTWNQRRVTITDSQGSGIVDKDGMQGRLLEQTQMDGTQVSSSTIHTYTDTQTADRATPATGGQEWFAYMVTDTKDQTRTWLPLTSTWRWDETDTTYNSYGLPTLMTDKGDTTTTADDTCTATTYVTPDTTKWLIDFVAKRVTTDCAATPGDADYLSGEQIYYDNSTTNGATPTVGLPTKTNDLASISGGTQTWLQRTRTAYDSYGRDTATYDSADNASTITYVPATGGPVTETKQFNAKGWESDTYVDPGHGSVSSMVDPNGKVTTESYDQLGRLVKVWENNRSSSLTPDIQYTYGVSTTAANWVEAQNLGPYGTQIASYSIYDGQGRVRQTQEPAPVANGGREVTDTQYDSHGDQVKVSTFYNNTSAPTSTLGTFSDAQVPQQEVFTYDNLERQLTDQTWTMGSFEHQTLEQYQGDRVGVIPPTGGQVEQKLIDVNGNTTELRQFSGSDFTGAFDATDYSYDRLGELTKVVDSSGNTWTYTYDLRGRTTQTTDPDSGTTTNTYSLGDDLESTKDGRGKTVFNVYDNLHRLTDTYDTSTSGTHLGSNTYDTIYKGELTSSTEYNGSTPLTTTVDGYTDSYQPTGQKINVPVSAGTALAGDWDTKYAYNPDSSLANTIYPAAGGLASEQVNYTYDNNGYELTVAGLDTYVSATAYQPWGDVYQRTLGTGSNRVQVTTNEYADTHKDMTISVGTEHAGTPGTFDEKFTQLYTWNPGGELTSIADQHAGTTTDSECFSYDNLQRLTTAFTTTPTLGGCSVTPSTTTVGGPDAYWQNYTYDKSGNRKSMTSYGLGGAANTTSTYTNPAAGASQAHTLTGVSTTGPAGTATSSYTYLGGGQMSNMTVSGLSTDFAWTIDGQLQSATIHATGGDQTTSYSYDTDGNEILRATPTGMTLYLDGTDVNTNAAGSAVTGVTRYYKSSDGTTVASRNDPGTLSWLANNDQNTATVAIDQTTLAVTIRKQDPFGNARGTVANWPNPHGFVGGTTEPTGLVHLGARMYDPTTGRFISDDPVARTQIPQQLNGYSYALNSPESLSDPDGLDPCPGGGGGCGYSDTPTTVCQSDSCRGAKWIYVEKFEGYTYKTYTKGDYKYTEKIAHYGEYKYLAGGNKNKLTFVTKWSFVKSTTKTETAAAKRRKIAEKIAKYASDISDIVGFIPGFLCEVCGWASAAFEFIAGVFEFLAGNAKAGIDAMVTTAIDFLGAKFQVAGKADSEVQHWMYKNMGTITFKIESFVKIGASVIPKKYLPNFASRAITFVVNGAVSALEDLNGSFTY